MIDDQEVMDLRDRVRRVERELQALPVRVPRGAGRPVTLIAEIEGSDLLFSSGPFSVTGISDDPLVVPSELPSVTPAAPYPANMGEGVIVSSEARVWVATRVSVGGAEKTLDIGDVPENSRATAPESYLVPVTGGGQARVYVLSEFK